MRKIFLIKVEYLRKKYGMTIDIIYLENFSSTRIRKRRAEPSGLDPLSELYFYETDKSKIVPVENLRIVEPVTPESIAEAEENLRRVLT